MSNFRVVRAPYLVQRCTIVRPLTEGRFSEVAKTDYMGSAEFEFGAMPASLRRLQGDVDEIQMTVTNEILNKEGQSLRILHCFEPHQLEEYIGYLKQMRAGKLRLKEGSRFEAGREPSKYDNTDLWWDIVHDAFWSFDKIFMNRLSDSLVASWKYMDEQRKSK